jgi:hypothetical protein
MRRASILVAGMNYRGYDERICAEIAAHRIEIEQLKFPGRAPTRLYRSFPVGAMTLALTRLTRQARCEQFVSELSRRAMQKTFDVLLLINPVFLLNRDWLRISRMPVYSWFMDPVWRYPQFAEAIAASRQTWSYDPVDCRERGLRYLPLFSLGTGRAIPFDQRDIDFCFVGALYPERIRSLSAVVKFAQASGRRIKMAGSLHQSIRAIRFVWERLFPHIFRDFEEISLSPEACLDIYSRSRCVLNFHASGHAGFSMRTYEALDCGSNVLTELAPTGDLEDTFSERILVARKVSDLTPDLLKRAISAAPSSDLTQRAMTSLRLPCRVQMLLDQMELNINA